MTETKGAYNAGNRRGLPTVRREGTAITGDLKLDLYHVISGYLVFGGSTNRVLSVLEEILGELQPVTQTSVDADTANTERTER